MTGAGAPALPTDAPRAGVAALRLMPRFEEWPRAVELAQTVAGKLVLLAAFLVLYRFNLQHGWSVKHGWLEVGIALAATTFLPRYRRVVVSLAAVYWLATAVQIPWGTWEAFTRRHGVPVLGHVHLVLLGLTVAFCFTYSEAAARWPRAWPLRHPLRTLLVLYGAVLVAALHTPLPAPVVVLLYGFAVVLGRLLWFLAYTLGDRGSPDRSPFFIQFGHYAPFWGSTNTPFPKGGATLRRIEVQDATELARVQLKGLKLLVWATVLAAALAVFRHVVYGTSTPGAYLEHVPSLRLPTLEQALAAHLHGTPCALAERWVAVVANFVEKLLGLAMGGHRIIACARMAGFNALRSTYRPLSATSLADWWNRVYYYFKELLAEFFFFPTYLACFKRRPRLRLLFATFMAAGVGNLLYHYLADIGHIASQGVPGSLWSFQVYAAYCLILGIAIGLSQLRLKSRQRRGVVPRWSLRGTLVIVGFYCILGVLDDPDRSLTLKDYGGFLLSLVGGG